MQAIITRFHGPTNTRGSRIVAHCEGGRYTHAMQHNLSPNDNHTAAALELARRLGWEGEWIAGHTRDSTVWINTAGARCEPAYTFTVEGN